MPLTLSRPRGAAAVVLLAFLSPATAQRERPPEKFQIAVGLLQRGMHEEAAGYFEAFLEDNGRHALAFEAWYRLATCQVELERREDAAESFGKALRGGADFRLRAECLYRMATVLKELEKPREALVPLQNMLRENDASHYLYAASCYAAGECLRDLNDDASAVVAFGQAAEAAKGEQATFAFPALYQAGFAQLRRGENAAAAALFAKAAAGAADGAARAECHYLAGDAALRAEDLDKAEPAFRQAVQLGGEFADDARSGLAWVALGRGDAEAALGRFRAVISEHGDSPLVPQARLELGRLLYRRGDHAAARAELRQLLQGQRLPDEQRAAALELNGLAALESDDPDAAIQSFSTALQVAVVTGDRARLQHGLGEAYAEKGQWQQALAAYRLVQGDVPDPLAGDALYGACLALHRLDRYQESIAAAQKLLSELPSHRLKVLARFAVAENLFALGNHAAADASYAQVPQEHELAGKAAFKRAWCSYLAGDRRRGAECFGAIAGDGASEFAEEALSMAALAWLETGDDAKALAAADRYRARHASGEFLARTERVAARVLRGRGDLKGAAARMAKAADSAGRGGDAGADLLEQAELIFQQGDFAGAQQVYAKLAAREDRSGARALEGLAWCAFELGNDTDCLKLLERGMAHPRIGDDRASLLELESALHHRAKEWAAAATAAEKFLEDYSGHENANEMRYALGVAKARGGQLKDAREVLEELAGAQGVANRDRVYYELAWTCRRAKDEAAALAAFGKVAELSRDADLAGEAHLHLGVAALDAGDVGRARSLLAKAQGRYRAKALYRLGFVDLEAEDADAAALQRAREAFAAIVQMGAQEPLHLEATFLVGECWFRVDNQKEAAGPFRALLQADPEHDRAQSARLKLGECAALLGAPDESVTHLEQFLRGSGIAPLEQARAQLWLGRACQQRSEHARAEQSFLRVTELSEGVLAAEAQYRIGESRLQRDELQGAADAFVKLPILYAHEEWVRKGLLSAGECYERLKQPAKARRFYEELMSRYPDAPETRQARSRMKGV